MMHMIAIRIADEGAVASVLWGLVVLLGGEWQDWERYGGDGEWWAVHLAARKN